MRKRLTTREERSEFESAFAQATPIKVAPAKPAKRKPVTVDAEGGLDGNTRERLKRGQVDPDARLDLHGFTEAAAHDALLVFLRSAQARRAKLVLVVTGKGRRAPEPDTPFDMELDRRSRGVLKTAVPRWLREPGFAAFVAGSQDAHRKHGGTGALYIYLRKAAR